MTGKPPYPCLVGMHEALAESRPGFVRARCRLCGKEAEHPAGGLHGERCLCTYPAASAEREKGRGRPSEKFSVGGISLTVADWGRVVGGLEPSAAAAAARAIRQRMLRAKETRLTPYQIVYGVRAGAATPWLAADAVSREAKVLADSATLRAARAVADAVHDEVWRAVADAFREACEIAAGRLRPEDSRYRDLFLGGAAAVFPSGTPAGGSPAGKAAPAAPYSNAETASREEFLSAFAGGDYSEEDLEAMWATYRDELIV